MQAYVINRFGGPEVFEPMTLPRPEPRSGQVLIRVAASSVNPVDCKIRRGDVPVGPEFPAVLHADVSGVVEEVGAEVKQFAAGDEVYGCAGGLIGRPGALAEYMLADAALLAPRPEKLSLQDAAVVPLVGITAWEAIVEKGAVQPDEQVLIHGGTGGVGHMAVQLANWRGARVAATSGQAGKLKQAGQVGVKDTINYREETVEQYVDRCTDGRGFDLVFDTVGQPVLDQSIAAAALKGRVVTIGGRSTLDLKPAFQKSLSLHTVFMLINMLHNYNQAAHGEILRELAGLIDAGRIKPLIHERRFGFSEVAEAHALLESGKAMGKISLVADWG